MSKLIFNGKECPENEFVDIYYPNGTLLARTNNDLEFHWLLKEIGIQNEDGYYLIFHGEKISIDKYGVLDYQPSGCMDNMEKIIEEKHNIHTNCISEFNGDISKWDVSGVKYKESDLVL